MNYQHIAKNARLAVLEMIHNAGTSHIGSNLSCIDILAVLFEKMRHPKDKIVFSKGWVAASAYYFLAEKGYFPKQDLATYCKPGSKYIGLVEPTVNGIEAAGGAMGHGLPMAVGMAYACKLNGDDTKIYCLMSDGEMDCGTTWESALLAAHLNLNNLVVIIDKNGIQAMGATKDILDTSPLSLKFESFGWQTIRIDGHDYSEIEQSLGMDSIRPTCIIAKTIKGKGISFMEGKVEWHYKNVDEETFKIAARELMN